MVLCSNLLANPNRADENHSTLNCLMNQKMKQSVIGGGYRSAKGCLLLDRFGAGLARRPASVSRSSAIPILGLLVRLVQSLVRYEKYGIYSEY